jgi:hypothetical protein
MDLFKDCEIQRMHLRGSPVVLIVGDRAVSADEGAELLAQYAASFGRSTAVPAYVSSDGWQLLKPPAERRAAVAATTAAVSETKPAEPETKPPESVTPAPESASAGAENASKPADPASLARPVIHAQHGKKGGR